MYVACSTQCFSQQSFEEALRTIADLQFSKYEVTICERGCQLRPSEVVQDVASAAGRLRFGPGLTPTTFSVEIEASDEADYDRQFQAICRLARVSTVPLISLKAALLDPSVPPDTSLDEEVQRLTRLVRIADTEGIQVTVKTMIGTLTEDPDMAVTLCERVPGLGLTLDPSHYIAGPHQGKGFDQVYPYVRHVHLRDTGRKPEQFQVRVGQGSVEYGRIIAQLARHGYDRILSVELHDVPEPSFPMQPEVRKLKYLLESLV